MRRLRILLMALWPLAATATPAEDPLAPPPPTMEERAAAFGEINTAMTSGALAQAADLLIELASNEEHAVFHAEAYARLALVLSKLQLPYGSLLAFEKALRVDPNAVGGEVGRALDLGEQVGDSAILEPVFANNLGIPVDDVTRSRIAYLAARENHRRDNHAIASTMLLLVQPQHPDYPDAQSLLGVSKAMQGKHIEALIPLQIAIATGAKAKRGERFAQKANLNIARSYYTAGNFIKAIEYYAKIPRDDPKWLDTQFERAWAHFRIQDMNGALAQLQTHTSPFFDDLYYPEGALLRIYGLFMLCKFPDASKQLEAFQKQYRPQYSRLMEVAAMKPRDLFEDMRTYLKDGKSDLPPSLIVRFANDDRLLDSLRAIKSAEDELSRLRNISANPFAAIVSTWVMARKDALALVEGERIHSRARHMERELGQMLADSDISKLDMLQMETRLYERASIIGELPEGKRRVKRQVQAKANQRIWPWQGEYWADEVGYYRIDTKPDCPEGMQVGAGTSP